MEIIVPFLSSPFINSSDPPGIDPPVSATIFKWCGCSFDETQETMEKDRNIDASNIPNLNIQLFFIVNKMITPLPC